MKNLLALQKILVIGAIISFFVLWGETSGIIKFIFFLILAIWLFAQYQGHKFNEAEKAFGIQEPNSMNIAYLQFFAEIIIIIFGLIAIF